MISPTRSQLRQQLRQARKALSPREQRQASRQLFRQLAQQPIFRRSRHIAFYLANDAEIDPAPLLRHAQRLGKHCYLPVVNGWPHGFMRFQRLYPGQRWKTNRFGIREPRPQRSRQVPVWRLNLVLMPLVGFDQHGNRLGMGGGFYDRALAYRQRRQQWPGPCLLGMAHRCQKVAQLPAASWDIPLDGIVSDAECLLFKAG